MPFSTDEDRPRSLRQRDGHVVFTEGAEQSNVDGVQDLLQTLLEHKDEMGQRCEEQLGDLFANAGNSYGRARAVGMTAREASGLINRAFQK
jgi:hypothetical protein